jgi:hypothetical protein
MIMRTTGVLATLLLAITSIDAQSDERKLTLSIVGGLPAARNITVVVVGTGDFKVTGSGLPFTDSGLTKLEDHRSIDKSVTVRLFALADRAASEWRGTGEVWPDCTSAILDIQGEPKPVHARSGCISEAWLSRSSIREFLASVNQFLPPGWTVGQ